MIECNQIDASAAVPRQGMGIRLAFRAHAENISSSSRRKPTRNVVVSSLEVHVSSSRKTSPCFPRTSSHPSNYSYHHYKLQTKPGKPPVDAFDHIHRFRSATWCGTSDSSC
ncbi:hypothetical protein ACFX2B_030980 [Malus domestica]